MGQGRHSTPVVALGQDEHAAGHEDGEGAIPTRTMSRLERFKGGLPGSGVTARTTVAPRYRPAIIRMG